MSSTEAPTPQPPLRRRILRGLAWGAVSQVVLQISRMVVAIILARLLAPDDYGVAAMVLVFSSLMLVFSDLGLGAALVQRKVLTDTERNTAFWTSVGAGVVFTFAGIATAGLIANFYGEPAVKTLCIGFSIVFFLTSLGATQEALLVRDMKFRELEMRTMGATAVGAVAGISIALLGGGSWAIIGQQLTEALIGSTLLWFASPWRPRFMYSRPALRELWGFSGWLVGHRLLYYVHRNSANILIGRYVGAAALGTFTVASNMILVPFSRIAGPIQRVLWPAFAEMQDDRERIAAGWVRVTRILAAVAMPALAGLVVVAPDFIGVVLGEKWAAAAPLVQALAWVGILQTIQVLSVDILQARGKTSVVFRFTIFFTIAHLISFIIGLQWGALGVAVAYAISSTFVEPVLTYIVCRELQMSPWRMVRGLAGVFQATVLMAVGVFLLRSALIEAGLGQFARLAICVAVGAVLYVVATLWRVPELRAEVVRIRGEARPVRPIVHAETT